MLLVVDDKVEKRAQSLHQQQGSLLVEAPAPKGERSAFVSAALELDAAHRGEVWGVSLVASGGLLMKDWFRTEEEEEKRRERERLKLILKNSYL